MWPEQLSWHRAKGQSVAACRGPAPSCVCCLPASSLSLCWSRAQGRSLLHAWCPAQAVLVPAKLGTVLCRCQGKAVQPGWLCGQQAASGGQGASPCKVVHGAVPMPGESSAAQMAVWAARAKWWSRLHTHSYHSQAECPGCRCASQPWPLWQPTCWPSMPLPTPSPSPQWAVWQWGRSSLPASGSQCTIR